MDLLPLWVSLKLAAVTTAVLIVLAAPAAYLLVHARFPGKTFVEALVNLPLALPPTVLGFYLLVVMGPNSPVGRGWEQLTGDALLFSFAGIAAASVVYSIPFAVQPMKAAYQKIDRRLLENADVLGLTPLAAFIRVVIPNSLSGIAASAVLVFLHSLGAFGVLLMIGGSIPGETRVASIAVYEAVESMNYREAGILSLGFIPVCYLFLLLINRLDREERNGA